MALLQVAVMGGKVFLLVAFAMAIRWTLPRFRFDQLMKLAWEGMIPASILLLAGVSVMVYLSHAADPCPLIAQGCWEGRIARAPRGDGGFGYDPVFIAEGGALTAAELEPARKNAVSHRGQALRALVAQLAPGDA